MNVAGNILIGSAPSSGSSLLVNIIGRAPDVFQCEELAIFDKYDWIRDPAKISWAKMRRMQQRGYRRRIACEQSVSYPSTTIIPQPSESDLHPRTYVDHCAWVMDALAKQRNKTCWVEKTPSNVFSMKTIARQYQDWHYVFIVRDPRSVLLSLSKRGYSPALAAARWYLPNLAAFDFLKTHKGHLVRYEDLVTEPTRVLQDLGRKIGVRNLERTVYTQGREYVRIPSWQGSASGQPVKSGLWTGNKEVPKGYLEALELISPAESFRESYSSQELPDTQTLTTLLGYDVNWPVDKGISLVNRLSLSIDYAKYSAAIARRGYLPRSLPFNFA